MAKAKPPDRRPRRAASTRTKPHPAKHVQQITTAAPPAVAQPRDLRNRLQTGKYLGITGQQITLDLKESDFPHEAIVGTGRNKRYDVIMIKAWRDSRGKKGSDQSEAAKQTLLDTKREKLQQEKLKTRDMQREEEIALGALLPRQDYELFTIETITEARDRLLGIPIELRKHLCPKCLAKIPDELTRMLETALAILARLNSGPAKNES